MIRKKIESEGYLLYDANWSMSLGSGDFKSDQISYESMSQDDVGNQLGNTHLRGVFLVLKSNHASAQVKKIGLQKNRYKGATKEELFSFVRELKRFDANFFAELKLVASPRVGCDAGSMHSFVLSPGGLWYQCKSLPTNWYSLTSFLFIEICS